MPIYKQTMEITNIDDLLSSVERDIEEIYFGDKNVFTVWDTYDGTLPATYSANGSVLSDYRVYGSAGGVGDRTINLWNVPLAQGAWRAADGIWFAGNAGYVSNTSKISVDAETTYNFTSTTSAIVNRLYVYFWDSSNTYLGYQDILSNRVFNTPPNAVLLAVSIGTTAASGITPSDISNVMLTLGSTAPASYIPYGYELDMSVSDGNTSTTTPIYIGDEPLGEDEYVDYGEQKVYRRTEQLWDYEKITVTVGERYGIIVPNGQYSIRNDTNRTIYVVRDYGIQGENVTVACAANSTATLTMQSVQISDIRFYIGGTDNLQSGVTIVAGSAIPTSEIPYCQPTDPPVPLPELPTVDGTNVVDYAGQSVAVPSRLYAKYRKEGFN